MRAFRKGFVCPNTHVRSVRESALGCNAARCCQAIRVRQASDRSTVERYRKFIDSTQSTGIHEFVIYRI